jgi:tRNA G46 methylase TrmB
MSTQSEQPARAIVTNQDAPHDQLSKVVTRHLTKPTQKPFSEHTLDAFKHVMYWLDGWQGKIILDSCCGVGESTASIAHAHPDCKVIGIDKSAMRTNKHASYAADVQNYLVIRADLNDFLRLLILENISLYKHYLLYPNPYPKSSQLQKRWHASSAFPSILQLGGILEVRSNWQLYIQEFSMALTIANYASHLEPYQQLPAITPFERKYWQSGQTSWRLVADLNKA